MSEARALLPVDAVYDIDKIGNVLRFEHIIDLEETSVTKLNSFRFPQLIVKTLWIHDIIPLLFVQPANPSEFRTPKVTQ